MQKPVTAEAAKSARLPNPFIDFAIIGLELQLKAWQAFQVEGTQFVAKRMHLNLEHLRKLGHCCEAQSFAACQSAWWRDCQKDYAEEWGRLAATSLALGFADLTRLGSLFGRRFSKKALETEAAYQPLQATSPTTTPSLRSVA